MSKRHAGDAILDSIAGDLGVGKRRKATPKTRVTSSPTGVLSMADPTGVSAALATTASSGNPTGVKPSATGAATRGSNEPTPTATTSAQADLSDLKQSVQVLTNQMGWFMARLAEDDGEDELEQEGSVASDPPIQDGAAEDREFPDTLAGLASFYTNRDRVAADIDEQLASIVGNLAKSRLADDKLKEKLEGYVRPANCETLVATRVNPEIWEKLSAATKSRDLKAQRVQTALVQAMVAVTGVADDIVAHTRSGEIWSRDNMAAALTGLVDALALLSHANQDVNQRRREDQRVDLNTAYRGLCTNDTDGSRFLYGDDLAGRVKSMNDTNRVASQLGGSSFYAHRAAPRGRSSGSSRLQPAFTHRPSWMGRFRGAFLGQPSLRGRSAPRRGQRAHPGPRSTRFNRDA